MIMIIIMILIIMMKLMIRRRERRKMMKNDYRIMGYDDDQGSTFPGTQGHMPLDFEKDLNLDRSKFFRLGARNSL